MADFPVGVGFRAFAVFVNSSGVPITDVLSPAPVFTLLSPAGTTLINAQTMTHDGSTEWWYYDIPAGTTTTSGGHRAKASCADSDVANSPVLEVVQISDYNLDTIQAKTDLITSGAISVISPVAPTTLLLTVIRGDDYTIAAGRAITWTSTDWSAYGLLTATAITFKAQRTGSSDAIFTKSMTAISSTAVRLELTDAETAAFVTGSAIYKYDVELTMANGEVVTLVQARMTVTADVR